MIRKASLKGRLVGPLLAVAMWLLCEAVVAWSEALVDAELRIYRTWSFDLFQPSERYGHVKPRSLRAIVFQWYGVTYRFATDSHGWDNDEAAYASAPLAVVGDSFVELPSLPRRERFYGLLEQRLGIKSLAYGIGGYGTLHYNRLVEDYVLHSPARVVVLCIFANDLAVPRVHALEEARAAVRKRWPPFYKRTMLYSLLSGRWWGRTLTRPPPVTRDLSPEVMLWKGRGTDAAYETSAEQRPEVERLVAATLDAIAGTGRRAIVLLIPSRERVYAEDYVRFWPEDGAYLGIERRGYARLAEIAIARGAAVVDLAEPFRLVAARGRPLYYKRDGHWNGAGNEVAATMIEGAVRDALRN